MFWLFVSGACRLGEQKFTLSLQLLGERDRSLTLRLIPLKKATHIFAPKELAMMKLWVVLTVFEYLTLRKLMMETVFSR